MQLAPLVCLAIVTVSVLAHDEAFVSFEARFRKQYPSPAERVSRMQIFKENLLKIKQLNEDHQGYTRFGVNKFSDMTAEEFREKYLHDMIASQTGSSASFSTSDLESLPTNFDWSSEGIIGPVEDQGEGGKDASYSVVEELSSMFALQQHPLKELSADTLATCCPNAELPTDYYNCLIQQKDSCTKFGVRVTAWREATSHHNETLLQYNLYHKGPVVVCVDSAQWMFYESGVFTNCGDQIDHCVQLTGYGVSKSGIDYWRMKNSWGDDWGESGFIRIQRGANTCGVTDYASIPSVR